MVRAALTNVAAWITLSAAVLLAAIKVITKLRMVRKFQLDDLLMAVATVGFDIPCIRSLISHDGLAGCGRSDCRDGLSGLVGLGPAAEHTLSGRA